MRRHAKAVSAGSSQGTGIRSGVAAVAALLLLLALAASPASAAYQQTAEWDASEGAIESPVGGIAVDSLSGDVFTPFTPPSGVGHVNKWTSSGAPGTPASFGDTLTEKSKYTSVAIDPTTHNVYALADTLSSPIIGIFQPDGTFVSSFPVTTDRRVRIEVDAAGNVYVPNTVDGTVDKYDASGALLKSFGPNPGGTPLNSPTDVAVDSSGNVYVTDAADDPKYESQTFDIHEATGGTYTITFNGLAGPATGTGDLTTGTGTGDLSTPATGTGDFTASAAFAITNKGNTEVFFFPLQGTFSAGESISGPTIAPGTTIASVTEVEPGLFSMILSQPATETVFGTEIFSGSKQVTNVLTSTGAFSVGESISGPSIPPGATITAVGAGTLTMSEGATGAANGAAITSGSKTVSNFSGTGSTSVGDSISGNGIPAGTTVTAIGPGTLTLSEGVTEAGTGVALNTGSRTVTDVVTTQNEFSVGQTLVAPGIPSETKITSVGASTLQLSKAPTVGAAAAPLTGNWTTEPIRYDGNLSDDEFGHLPTVNGPDGNRCCLFLKPGVDYIFFNLDKFSGLDLPLVACDGSKLTGGPNPGTCTVNTPAAEEVEGPPQDGGATPGRVVKFASDGSFVSNFVAPGSSYTALAIDIDTDTGDIFVADGLNPHPFGGFSLKRYSPAGAQLEEVGLGTLSASSVSNGGMFDVAVDPSTHMLNTVDAKGQVRVFTPTHPLTVTADGNGGGTVDADSGAIANCSSSGGICTDEYLGGETISLTATPDSHSEVSWSGCDAEPGATECEVQVSGASEVTATFSLIQRTLTVTADGTGEGTVDADSGAIEDCSSTGGVCEGGYDETSTVTLIATPAPGNSVTWSGCDANPSATECEVEIDADKAVTATFTVGQRNVSVVKNGTGQGTVTAGSGAIDCGATCSGSYEEGSTVTLTAAPALHSTFTGWSGCDATPSANECEVEVDSDLSVTATFTTIQHTVSVTKDGSGTGTVTANSGPIDCGATCSGAYDEGSSVTLSAAPALHSSFTGWSGAGCSGTATCVISVDGAKSVTATFAKITHDVSVTKDGSGTGTVTANSGPIDCGATCSGAYDEGSSVTLSAAPALHSSFTGWSGAGCSGTATCVVSVDGAKSVTATFAKITHSVSVTRNGTGAGTITASSGPINCGATCSGAYDEGSSVTLSAAPALHSSFTGWSGAGCSGTATCVVSVDAAKSVTATFALISHQLDVTVDGDGAGTIDADFGAIEDCAKTTGTCTAPYIEGTTVTLTATPGAHSAVKWQGCDSAAASECTVVLDADKEVKATFSLISHALTIATTGSGSVACNGGACAPTYTEGTKVTLSATAAPGSTFAGWAGACSGTGECAVTIDSDKAVGAAFAANPVPPLATCATDPSLCPKPKVIKCKKGFKKKKVKGKTKCVKVKKARKRHKR